jgi:hypothetical protein
VRIARDDRGSISVVVAVAMLFLAMPLLWLVVDGGGMYAERRQLQNAADAGVLAAAQACSEKTNPADCSAGLLFAKSKSLVEDNDFFDSMDDRNKGVTFEQDIWYICGSAVVDQHCEAGDVAGELQTYGVSDCPAKEPSGQYIQIRVVSGGEGWKGLVGQTNTQVFACARARVSGPEEIVTLISGTPEWVETFPVPGTSPSTETNVTPASWPSSANVLALTFSVCEWENAKKAGTLGQNTWIEFNPPEGCDVLRITSGSFGGLEQSKPNGTGIQNVSITNEAPAGPGEPSNWRGVADALRTYPDRTWLIPIYDRVTGTGVNARFHIVGFGAFKVEGFYFSNNLRDSARVDQKPETLYGHFVSEIICDGQAYVCSGANGNNYGVYVPETTSTTTHPGTPASSYYITHSAVPDTSETTTVSGNPASAKPVL